MIKVIEKHKALILIFSILVLVFIVSKLTGLHDLFTIKQIQEYLNHHWFLSSGVFILIFTIGNIVQIPGWILLLTAILTYGEVYGGILTFISAVIACSIVFLGVNFIGKDSMKKINNKWASKLLSQLELNPVRSVILLRFVFQTAPPINYALGASNISFKNYFIGTILGLPIPISIYVLFFETLLLVKTSIN
jgi:uncharacterized membrane protein YdjX (TVP38/TMEM64 family)